MIIKKSKALSFIIAMTMLTSLTLMPLTSFAKTISEKVEDAVEEIDDLENDMNDLEDEIPDTYGTTVKNNDVDTVNTPLTLINVLTSNLITTGVDTDWDSGECLYEDVDGLGAVSEGDIRVIPCATYAGDTTIQPNDTDINVAVLNNAINVSITGADDRWDAGEEVYLDNDGGGTVTTDDTRVTNSEITEIGELSGLFNDINDLLEDVENELDDLKGYSIADDDLDDLDSSVSDFLNSADDTKDEIDSFYHSVLSDDFDERESDYEDDVDNLEDDLADVKNGVDTDNADVDDFVEEMGEIEDSVDNIKDQVDTQINTETKMQGYFDDLSDELEKAEDEIDDLEGEEFSSTDQAQITDAWDDLEAAMVDTLDEIEEGVDDGTNNDLDDNFDDEKEDFESDMQDVEEKLDRILLGEEGSDISRKAENAIDDIDSAKDEIKDQKSDYIKSYGLDIETDDNDYDEGVTAVSLYTGNAAWTTNSPVYKNGAGVALVVDEGDTRVTHAENKYLAGYDVIAADDDINDVLVEALFYQKGSSVYYYCPAPLVTLKLDTSCDRVSREELMYDTELDDLFEAIGDEVEDVEDALQDVQNEELSDVEIEDIENAYNDFKDKTDTYTERIEDDLHSTLDDDYENLIDDYERDMGDLDSLMDDIKEGTSSSVSEVVTDFEDELDNIENDIDDEKNEVASVVTLTSVMTSHFSDLSNLLDDVESEVEDLAGYSFSDSEEGRVNDAFDDVKNATEEAVDTIEDNLANDDQLESDFDDEKNDLEDELSLLEADLASILEGGSGSSREINDLVDDLKDSKDDIDEVYTDAKGIDAGSLTERRDMENLMDDIDGALDDAEDALTDYSEIPSSLGVARIKNALDGIQDKMDDAVNEIEEVLEPGNENLEDDFKDEEDKIEDKYDDVQDAAQYIYDLLPASSGSGDDDDDDDDDDGSGDGDDDGSGGDDDGDGGYTEVSFIDVPSSNVFNEYVQALASLEIINGYYDGTFRPDNPVTRGEFLKIAAGAAEVDVANPSGIQRFVDVPSYHTFYNWVDYAATMGHISGYSDGTFRPDDYITRFEAVVILLRFMGTPVSSTSGASQYFIDVTTPAIAAYTDAAFENGLISGYPDNTFKPDNNISRGETSKIAVNGFS